LKPLRIELLPRARRHLASIKRRFGAHGRLHILQADFAAVLSLLTDHPEAGAAFEPDPRFRRVLMPRTQYYVYYGFYQEMRALMIVAVWSTARGKPPRL
jgi:plasmid stabilization system protein ParE